MRILIINGPNINLVGVREPEIYGDTSFDSFYSTHLLPLASSFEKSIKDEIRLDAFQSNSEGELVSRIQDAGFGPDELRADAIIINAGAYTHYSLAIADALRGVDLPAIEVHISNIFARETERHISVLAPACTGMIAGLGLKGYELALRCIVANEESAL